MPCSKQRLFLLSALLLALGLHATPSIAEDVDLPRYPSLSPDGKDVVFSWRGDLWRVGIEGGKAVRLTSHPGVDSRSAWHPEGSVLVFESDRDGYRNIWSIDSNGDGLRQVVKGDTSAILSGFGVGSHGAPTVVFDGRFENDFYRGSRPYEVPLDGGQPTRVHDAFGSAAQRSPDGSRVLFERGRTSWTRRGKRGSGTRDIWLHSPEDGFVQLTTWDGNDGFPHWLDDETMLFLSDRELGAVNLYRQSIVPGVEMAERLTDFTEHDVTDFDVSADGRQVVLQNWDRLYALDLDDSMTPSEVRAIEIEANTDGLDRVVPKNVSSMVTEAELSPDGKVMAVVAYGDVWVRNVADGSPTRRVTESLAHDRSISWSPDGLRLYFTSDEEGTDGIYAAEVALSRSELQENWSSLMEPDSSEDESTEADDARETKPSVKPALGLKSKTTETKPPTPEGGSLTDISGDWVAECDIPGTGMVTVFLTFEAGDDGVMTVTFEAAEIVKGDGTVTIDPETGALSGELVLDNTMRIPLEGVSRGGTLTGQLDAVQGVIEFTASRVEAEDETNSKDDKEDKEDKDDEKTEDDPRLDPKRWHDALRFDISEVLVDDRNISDPKPSPDGRMLAVRQERGDVLLLDLATGEETMAREGWDRGTEFVWAPDSRALAVSQADLDFNYDIWFVPVDDPDAAVNVSRHPDNDLSPRFSADGRILVFSSERKEEAYDVYRVYLDRTLDGLLDTELDEYYADAKKAVKKRKPAEPWLPDLAADLDDDENEDSENESGDDPEWTPSLDDAYKRLDRMTSYTGNERTVRISPAGDQIVFQRSSGPSGTSGIWSVDWKGNGAKRLGSGSLGEFTLTGDKVATQGSSGGWLTASGSSKSIPISARIELDLEEQSSRKFDEAARIFGMVFYHPEMKGRDWEKIKRDYHQLASRAWTSDEFNWVAARMLGEMNASHTGIRTPGMSSPTRMSQGRLGTRHRRVDDGFEVLEVIPGSPAEIGPMPLMPGDVILAIDDEAFEIGDTVESHLRGKSGREVVLRIRRPSVDTDDSIEMLTLIEPISSGAQAALIYDEQLESISARVDELSDGRLGYLHIKSMDQASLDVFERDLYAAAEGKEGLLVDVRNNGGGWTADRVFASLDARPHAYTVPRGADSSRTDGYPQDRLFIQRYVLPVNMLCNENSYSNAEIISHGFKALERGTLVGTQTTGSVISTGRATLIDGTTIRTPFRGWYLLDGTDMENNGAMPDIVVPQTPEDESMGHDEQLQRAVEDLLQRLPDTSGE